MHPSGLKPRVIFIGLMAQLKLWPFTHLRQIGIDGLLNRIDRGPTGPSGWLIGFGAGLIRFDRRLGCGWWLGICLRFNFGFCGIGDFFVDGGFIARVRIRSESWQRS